MAAKERIRLIPALPIMNRRHLILTSLIGVVGWPLAPSAQNRKSARVGVIGLTGAAAFTGPAKGPGYIGFQERLSELGWIEGKNLIFESRWADGKLDRLP